MATINSKIEGVDVLGVVTAGETIYVGRATSTQHGIVKPAATDFEFDDQTNAMLIKLGVGLKRTDDGIAIAIYDGNVVTDVLAVEDGLVIKYADIDEETENSKIIPWSEFTTAEIAYIKEHIGDWINIEPGTGEGAVQQIGAKATGPHSAAFGSRRYDKPTNESKRVTEAKGGNAFAAGGSVLADGDFTAAFGKETQAEQSASFAAGTKTQAGKTLEEYVAAGGNAEDYAKSYAAAAVFGDGNKAKGYADFVAGNANESDGTSNTTVGGANKVKGTRNFTGGEANEVGQSGSSDVGNALTFGQHLKNTGRWNRVTFGQFNADDLAALFEIGNGTSDTNRVNIFVVKDNGAIYTGKLGKLHQGTRFQVSDGNSENDRRALIDSRHNGVTHIESYMSTLNGSVGNSNKVAASESGELKDIADPTDGNYPLLNTFLAGQGLQNKGRFNQVVFGQFNEFDPLALFQVGTGNSDTDRKKGFRVDYAGRAKSDTATAGDEFYVRVADLGYEVDFPHGDPTVQCDNTDGITVTGTMRIYLNQAKTVFHDVPNVSVEIPIFAGKNVTIDADETNKKAIVKVSDMGSYGVDIGVGLPASATNGALTAEQLALLQSSENNYIMFQHEKYYLEDKGHVEGYITYTHTGYENSTYWIKSITITVSTRAWVLNKGGLAGKGLDFDTDGKLRVKAGANLSFGEDGTLNASGGGTANEYANTSEIVDNAITLTSTSTLDDLATQILAQRTKVLRVKPSDTARSNVERLIGSGARALTVPFSSDQLVIEFKVYSSDLIEVRSYVNYGFGSGYNDITGTIYYVDTEVSGISVANWVFSGWSSIYDNVPIGTTIIYDYRSIESQNPPSMYYPQTTWEQIKDVFLLAAGDTYTAGSTGGSADAVVVEHTHDVKIDSYYVGVTQCQQGTRDSTVLDPTDGASRLHTVSTGESGTGKNMPPYLTVYMWRRVA